MTPLPPDVRLLAAKPFEWSLLIRRLNLPTRHRKVKLVAYTLATYADVKDGKNVRPGVKRLMRDTGYGERWIRDSLGLLRENWLLHRHVKGSNSGKRNMVDIYQLCRPSDWEDRYLFLPDEPDEPDDPWAPT